MTTKKQAVKKVAPQSAVQFQAPAFTKPFAAKIAPFNSLRMNTTSRRFNLTGQMFFTKDHEYLKYDSETTAFVGISNHAQDLLGEIVYVELPEVDVSVDAKQAFCSIESVKSSNNVYAPVNLKVLKVNEALSTQPELINQDPHAQGWIAHVEPAAPGQHADLMTEEQYTAYCAAV